MGNIYLIGMMGSGKTTIGQKLAKKIGAKFIDSDREISNATNNTIAEIFSRKGEEYFRTVESKIVQTEYKSLTVISTGGGAILCADTRDYLKENGFIVYLQADLLILCRRVKRRNDEARPLLKMGEIEVIMQRLFSERKFLYEDVADVVVDTSRQHVGRTVDEIYAMWQAYIYETKM